MKRLDIYPGRNKSLEREQKRLKESKISKRNKELITDFQNYLLSTGNAHDLRAAKLTCQLRLICSNLNKDLDNLTKMDAVVLMAMYNKNINLRDATKADYRRVFKQFFLSWFMDQDERLDSEDKKVVSETEKLYKYLKEEVKTSCARTKIDAKTIITNEDCQEVVDNGCRTSKEKAFISLLHETGARAGEFLNITKADITIKENHAEIDIDGKTGPRTIFLVSSLRHLLRWLEVHPIKEDDSYLWVSQANNSLNQPLKHRAAQKLIDKCFKRAGVNKRHNLHWFRHSRASILAPKVTSQILCKVMGWYLDTKQVAVYCHLSKKAIGDIILEVNGIKSKEDEIEKPIKCICGALNNPKERYCFKCQRPLKVETVIQDQVLINSEVNKTIKFFMEMAKNPEMMQKFEKFKENLS